MLLGKRATRSRRYLHTRHTTAPCYEHGRLPCGHEDLLFGHTRPVVLLVLPSRREGDPVGAAHLQAVRTHVLENGLLTPASFERLLQGTGPSVASQ